MRPQAMVTLSRCEERGTPFGAGHGAAADDGGHEQHEADDGDLHDLARPEEAQVDAHEEGDRDGHADREDAPGALAQGVDDDQGQDGDDDHHDQQGGDQARRCRR